MNKKVTAKTQKIAPKLEPVTNEFSGVVAVDPETEEKDLIARKGLLYAVYDLEDSTKYEVDLANKLIEDILKHSYYQSENSSPIQALEKAIADVRENVLRLNDGEDSENIDFNMIVAIHWGNVFYAVIKGRGDLHLVRDGNFKSIDTITEGTFSVATGIIKKDDVIVLSTLPFSLKYPPKKLLKLESKDFSELDPKESCLMIKFDTENADSTDEPIKDFGKKPSKATSAKAVLSKIRKSLDNARSKKQVGITDLQINHKKKFKVPSAKTVYKFAPVLIALVLGISVFYSLKGRSKKDTNSASGSKTSPTEESPKNVATTTSETAEESFEAKTDPSLEVFYDLKIVKASATPTLIEIAGGKIYAVDTTGDLYFSDTETPKFDLVDQVKILGTTGIKPREEFLYFGKKEEITVLDTKDNSIEKIAVDGAKPFFPYLNAIYQIDGDKLQKHSVNEAEIDTTLWAQTEYFRNAKDIAISISIFVLTDDGEIVKYTTGVKDNDFKITGMGVAFNNAVSLKTGWDLDNLYVLDKGNNRVVVLSKDGKFIKDIKGANWSGLGGVKAMAIDSEEEAIFVLHGTRIYKATL